MRPITQLFLAGFLFLALSVTGQNVVLTTAPATVNAPVGSTFTVNLKASSGFTNVTSFQIPVVFDKTVLELIAVENLAPIANPALVQGVNFNINPTTSTSGNKIVFTWVTDFITQPNGTSLADGATIATLKFNVKTSGVVKVEVKAVPPGIEVIKAGGAAAGVTYTGAVTSVTAGTGGGGGGGTTLTGFKIIANTVNIPKGQTGCMPVRVNDFDSIIAVQYAMHWDPTVLTFECVRNLNQLPGLAASDFGAVNTSGLLTMAWGDLAGGATGGVTKVDGATIYEVCFKGIGNNGTQSIITIDGVGLPPSAGGADARNVKQTVNLATAGFGIADTLFINPTTLPTNAVTFSADQKEVPQNGTACVEIRGKGFSSITSAELPIVYDTTMLRFQSIQVGANPLNLAATTLPNANFSQSFVTGQPTGILKFIWANTAGVSLASDTSTLFKVCFRAKGAANSVAPVTLGGSIACTPVSATHKDAGSRTVALVSGSVTVKNASVVFNAAPAVVNVTCFGAATGTISVAPSGCSANYAYLWSNGQTAATATGLAAGTYTVTVSCSSGGSATATATVTQPANAVTAGTPVTTNANCLGTAGGSITLTPAGGQAPYRYNWTGPSFTSTTGPVITNLRAGNYTATIQDNLNCTTTMTATVAATTNTMSLTAAQIAKVNANCAGTFGGSITLSPSGGTTPYAFSWANTAGPISGVTTNALTNIATGNYNVTVTDANACSVTAAQINVPVTTSPVTIPTPVTVNPTCAVANGSITVNPANGVQPYAYSWTLGGTPLNITNNTVTNAASGNYALTVLDANGCSATTAINLSSGQGAVGASATTTPSSCFEPATGSINLTPSGGRAPYAVTWSGPSGYTATIEDPVALRAGNYRAVVTDADGCAFTTPDFNVAGPLEALGLNTNPTVTNPLCFGANTGSINIAAKGGTSGYTYSWSGPNGFSNTNQNITGLAAGTYTVTIRDANQCSFSAPVVVSAPTAIEIGSGVTNAACGNNGAIQITANGGNSPYTYQWTGPNSFTSTAQNISNLSSGDYRLTVRDIAGCTFSPTAPFSIGGSTNPLVLSATPINAKCLNENTGGAALTVTGGGQVSNYRWFNTANTTLTVSNTQNLGNVAPGIYNCVVTDVNGCTATLATPITVSGPQTTLAVTLGTVTGASCPEAAQGSIALVINGGWGTPYNVAWSGGLPSVVNPTAIIPGNYTATVTDAGGCSVSTQPVTVPGPPVLQITSIKVDSVSCAGTADGRITINVTGGNGGAYSAVWNGGILSGTVISNLGGKRTYTPTVMDKDGCSKTFAPIAVYEPDTMKVTSLVTKQTGTQANGAIAITVTGGTSPYKYEWKRPDGSLFSQTKDITGLNAGLYTIVITDAKGCGVQRTIEVVQDNPLGGAEVGTVKNSCENDGCITVKIPAGAQGPFVVRWNNGGIMNTSLKDFSVCSLKPGIYNLTLTDVASTRTLELPATEVKQLERAVFGSSVMNPNQDKKDGSIFLNPIPANAPVTFFWNDGKFGPTRIGLDSGLYIVTARHLLSDCTAMDTFDLERQYPALVVAPSNFKNESCGGKNDGAIALNVSGGNTVGGYTYKWSGPNNFFATTAAISNLAPGIYACTIVDGSNKSFVFDTTIVALSNLKVTNVNEISNYNTFQVSGFGKCDGVAEAVAAGGVGTLNYQWSNSATTLRNTTLCGGAYALTVTDALGCTAIWSDALTTPEQISSPVQFTKTISCAGRCDASARVTINGGLSPYRVSWSVDAGVVESVNSAGSYTERFNLCPGNYSLTITDRNNVVQISTITVTPKDPIVVDINNDIVPTSFRDCDGELLASASGTTGSVLYAWSSNRGNRGAERRAENLCPGEVVTFIITDGNGCTATVFDTVGNPQSGCLQARPVITPGEQDGKNDVFIIACIEDYQNTVEIYNRWGQLVFETSDYNNSSNSWGGTTRNGDPLPEGVYFYVINYTDGGGAKQQIKGYVNLIR